MYHSNYKMEIFSCQSSYPRICPFPKITYFFAVRASCPIGPRAWSFWVLIPISAPNPNSFPSVNLVDALTYTAAASTLSWKYKKQRRILFVNAGKIQIMEKELATYDRGKCRKLFFCNFIKGEMKIKSIKILKTSYLVSLSAILNLIL